MLHSVTHYIWKCGFWSFYFVANNLIWNLLNSLVREKKSPATVHCLMGMMPCLFLTLLRNQVRKLAQKLLCSCVYFTTLYCSQFFFLLWTWYCVLDDLGQDDAPTKPNPSLTEEKDLAVDISDLENILDEEDVGVKHPFIL